MTLDRFALFAGALNLFLIVGLVTEGIYAPLIAGAILGLVAASTVCGVALTYERRPIEKLDVLMIGLITLLPFAAVATLIAFALGVPEEKRR